MRDPYLLQRLADLKALEELRDSLPTEHREKPGLIRAVEMLKHEPLDNWRD